MNKILYVGMDVHKESITIATGRGMDLSTGHVPDEVRLVGTIPNTKAAIDSAIRKLVSTGAVPLFVYEAGPGGYVVVKERSGRA